MSVAARERHGTGTLVATGLGLFMIFLDASIVNVAIPDIQHDFGAGEASIQWIVSAYSLTLAMFMMSGATFSDREGRRRAYVIGIMVFCVASLACAAAPGIWFLSAARAVQGAGWAVVNVASLALVGAAYPEPRAKAKAIGVWSGIALIGFAFGPTIGGFLTESVGWRSIFLPNLIIGAVAVFLTFRHVTESRDPTSRSFDLPGQVLFIVGIGTLTLVLIEGPHWGWRSGAAVACFVASGVALVAFVLRELRARHPMMNVRVFRSGVYSAAIYAAFAVLFCVYGNLFLITQYFQNVRAYSPEQAGVLMLAMSVPTVVAAPLTGRIVAARGGRGPTLLGISCAAIGTGILAASSAALLPVTLIGIFFAGISGGIGVAAATSVAMGAIPAQRSGMASGILSTTRGLGSTAGFAIMGSILAGTIATLLPQRLEPLIPNVADRNEVVAQVVDGANPRAVTALIGPGEPLPDNVTTDQAVLQATDDVFVDGIRVAMLVGLGVALSSLVLAWFLFPRRAPPAAEEDRATYALARSAGSGNATA